MKTLFLCGAGNSEGVRLALSINRREPRWASIILLDDDRTKHGRKVLGVEIAGGFDALGMVAPSRSETANLIARTTARRRTAQERIDRFGLPATSLIAPDVDLEGSELGGNLVIYQQSVIGPETVIGDGSVIFMGAIVGHESRVGRGCVLGPQAVLNARVILHEGVYVGTHATVLPEIEVGQGATIGAGSVVMQDVPAGATVIGVPALPIVAAPSGVVLDADKKRDMAPPPGLSGAPVSWLEDTIAETWKQALGTPNVGRCDNFFRLGGNSLAALQITFQLRQLFQIDIPLQIVFDAPTVSELAQHLEPLVLAQADERLLSRLLQEVHSHPGAS